MTKPNKQTLKTGLAVLFKWMAKYKTRITVLSFLGIVSAIGNGSVPFIAGRFFDSILHLDSKMVLDGLQMPSYVALLILWSVIQFVTYIVDWMIDVRGMRLGVAAWSEYLVTGMSHLFELPLSFHKSHKIGSIGDKINRASNNIENIMSGIIIQLAPQFLSIIIALAIGFYIKPELAGVLLFGIIVYVLILKKSVAPLAGYQKAFHDRITDVWGDMYDAIGNVQTIKQATAEKYEKNKLDTAFNTDLMKMWFDMDNIWMSLRLYQKITILGTQTTVFILSIYFISHNEMTLGTLLAFNGYAAMMFSPFVTLGRQWQELQNGMVNLSEVEKILERPIEIYSPKQHVKMDDIMGYVHFSGVGFHYDAHKTVLKDINFEVKAGEIIALVGESGVGKSTLVDLISGYHFASKGHVYIDGVDIRKIDLNFLRSKIAVVPQEVVLFNDTIKTNIKYGNFESSDKDVEEASKKAHAFDFINKFSDKWNQLVGERGVKLSVGQKQRVAIARAILRNPKILILDEPTSALDAGSEHSITQSLEKLMEGKTTFIIAHRLSTVRKANKILVFKEGQIVESGTHEELLEIKSGEYRRLYELQVGLHA